VPTNTLSDLNKDEINKKSTMLLKINRAGDVVIKILKK
jgi:hypothetical protein